MRICLAGPYRNPEIIDMFANCHRGRLAATYLLSKGHDVYCPWLDCELLYTNYSQYLTVADFQRLTMSFIRHWAQGIVFLPGFEESVGTYEEAKVANEIELTFYKMTFYFDTILECYHVEHKEVLGAFSEHVIEKRKQNVPNPSRHASSRVGVIEDDEKYKIPVYL